MQKRTRPQSMSSAQELIDNQSYIRALYEEGVDAVYSPPLNWKSPGSMISSSEDSMEEEATRRQVVPYSENYPEASSPTVTLDNTFGIPNDQTRGRLGVERFSQFDRYRSSSAHERPCGSSTGIGDSEITFRRRGSNPKEKNTPSQSKEPVHSLDPPKNSIDSLAPPNVQLADVTISDIDDYCKVEALHTSPLKSTGISISRSGSAGPPPILQPLKRIDGSFSGSLPSNGGSSADSHQALSPLKRIGGSFTGSSISNCASSMDSSQPLSSLKHLGESFTGSSTSHGASSTDSRWESLLSTQTENATASGETLSASLSQKLPYKPTVPRIDEINDTRISEPINILVDIHTCEACLYNPDFRRIFRDWMTQERVLNYRGLIKLDRWTDETKMELMVKDVREYSFALFNLYHPDQDLLENVNPTREESENRAREISKLITLESGLQPSRVSLIKSLHQNEFQNFVKAQILMHLKREGQRWIPESGFSACFCLVNPRVSNCPIVLVSQNFAHSTGYKAHEMIGRTIQIIRRTPSQQDGLEFFVERSNSAAELDFCYQKGGGGFYAYWNIEPLCDPQGKIMFYLVLFQDITVDLNALLQPFLGAQSEGSPSIRFQFSPRMIENQSKEAATISSGRSLKNSELGRASSTRRDVNYLKTKYIKDWVQTNLGSINSRLAHNPKKRPYFLDRRNSVAASSLSFRRSNSEANDRIDTKLLEPAFQSIILTRRDRSIMYIPERTLNFLGFPTWSRKEVWKPTLLTKDLTTLLYSHSAREKNDIIAYILDLFNRGAPGICRCMIQCSSYSNEYERGSKTNESSAAGKVVDLHLMPLQSGNGNCSLYIATFI